MILQNQVTFDQISYNINEKSHEIQQLTEAEEQIKVLYNRLKNIICS